MPPAPVESRLLLADALCDRHHPLSAHGGASGFDYFLVHFNGVANFERCNIHGKKAGSNYDYESNLSGGGGLLIMGTATLTNTSVYFNVCGFQDHGGGVLVNPNGVANFEHCDIHDNTASGTGGYGTDGRVLPSPSIIIDIFSLATTARAMVVLLFCLLLLLLLDYAMLQARAAKCLTHILTCHVENHVD